MRASQPVCCRAAPSRPQAKIPKSAKVIVGCQKGLRSLAGCEQLSLAGYETLAWVNGGFDSCRAGGYSVVQRCAYDAATGVQLTGEGWCRSS